MKKFKTFICALGVMVLSLTATCGIQSLAYGGREGHTVKANQGTSYSTYYKQSNGKNQTLNTYSVGTYVATNYRIFAKVGTGSSFTSMSPKTKVYKGDSWDVTLSNTVDAGKEIRLKYSNAFNVSETDYISYQYLHK